MKQEDKKQEVVIYTHSDGRTFQILKELYDIATSEGRTSTFIIGDNLHMVTPDQLDDLLKLTEIIEEKNK